MSVILDALKKLDREKSSRRNGAANIAVEILKPDLPRPGRRVPLYFAIITLTVFATAAITYVVMMKFGLLPKSLPPATANPSTPSRQLATSPQESGFLRKPSPPPTWSPPAPSQHIAPTPRESALVAKSSPPGPATPTAASQQVAPAPISHEPVRDIRDETKQGPPKTEGPAESKDFATSLGEEKASQKGISENAAVAPLDTKKTVERTPNGSARTPPLLRLSAIVWYEEPSKRFAVVNGTITYEGSMIDGVKVVEIFPNRVRFSRNEEHFEISMFK